MWRVRSGAKPTDGPEADLTASLADGLRTGVFSAAPFVPVPKPPTPHSEPSAILHSRSQERSIRTPSPITLS